MGMQAPEVPGRASTRAPFGGHSRWRAKVLARFSTGTPTPLPPTNSSTSLECNTCSKPLQWTAQCQSTGGPEAGAQQQGWECDNKDICGQDIVTAGKWRWVCNDCGHDICNVCAAGPVPMSSGSTSHPMSSSGYSSRASAMRSRKRTRQARGFLKPSKSARVADGGAQLQLFAPQQMHGVQQ